MQIALGLLRIFSYQRDYIQNVQFAWNSMITNKRFRMQQLYDKMIDDANRVPQRHLLRNNYARPRAILFTWLACQGRLGTKVRLARFSIITERRCNLCEDADETLGHLLFECRYSKEIWKNVLEWIGIKHEPCDWTAELGWLMQKTTKKGWRFKVLKIAIAETFYGLWQYINDLIFGKHIHRITTTDNSNKIIENVMYRG